MLWALLWFLLELFVFFWLLVNFSTFIPHFDAWFLNQMNWKHHAFSPLTIHFKKFGKFLAAAMNSLEWLTRTDFCVYPSKCAKQFLHRPTLVASTGMFLMYFDQVCVKFNNCSMLYIGISTPTKKVVSEKLL